MRFHKFLYTNVYIHTLIYIWSILWFMNEAGDIEAHTLSPLGLYLLSCSKSCLWSKFKICFCFKYMARILSFKFIKHHHSSTLPQPLSTLICTWIGFLFSFLCCCLWLRLIPWGRRVALRILKQKENYRIGCILWTIRLTAELAC